MNNFLMLQLIMSSDLSVTFFSSEVKRNDFRYSGIPTPQLGLGATSRVAPLPSQAVGGRCPQ